MLALTRFIKRPLSDDTSVIVRSLVYLRLLVLAAASLLMILVSLHYESLSAATGMAAIVMAVAAWSALVLVMQRLARAPLAAVREVLVDFVWVFCLVLLSGRSANPFIYYYLVLVAICASIFSARTAWAFCIGGILAYSSMLLLDIGVHFEHLPERYRVHLAGMWLNYVGSSLVTCYFVSRLAKLIREQQAQLAAAREENLKNEQLIGVGTVAASTVHSLATPLSTLTVLTEEMASTDSVDPSLREDLALMLAQIHRCKQTMKELATLAQGWSAEGTVTVEELQSELEEYYSLNSPGNIPHFVLDPAVVQRRVSSNPILRHALVNLINNAIESEGAPAQVKFSQHEQALIITIDNDTTMSPDEVFQRWGKPRLSEKQTGLGIGSFLANSTIEKLGGTVQLQAEEGGTAGDRAQVQVTVSLPLEK